MSVLIEAFTLIVQRSSLDLAYPGGAEAFLRDTNGLADKPRFACDGDPLLVNIAFEQREHASAAAALLEKPGAIASEWRQAFDFVLVHHEDGPVVPCRWLNWERFGPGVTIGWLAGRDPGAVAAPAEWQAARSRTTKSIDHDLSDLFRLSSEEGIATYLDLATGEQFEVPVAPHSETEVPIPVPTALFDSVMTKLTDAGWVTYLAEAPAVMVDLRGEQAMYTSRYFVGEEQRTIICSTRCPVMMPKRARRKAMEFITRANFGMMFGAFELNLDDGMMFFRTGCNVADGVPTMEMVCDLPWAGAFAFDRYLPRLLEVVYGKRPVGEAVREADG